MKENLLTKEYFDQKLGQLSTQFVSKDYLDQKLKQFISKDYLDEKFEEFARMIADQLSDFSKKFGGDLYDLESQMNDRFDRVDDKIGKIEGHIGRMEIRFSHLDEIVLKDHTPRIRRLEDELGI